MAGTEAILKNVEMNQRMTQHAIDCAAAAFQKFRIEEDIAKFIKTEFDIMYAPSWHCIVGKSFGSYIAHQTNHMVYFYIGEVGILLWHTVQKEFLIINNAAAINEPKNPSKYFYKLSQLLGTKECLKKRNPVKQAQNTQRSEKAITRNKKIDFSHMGERQSYYYSYQTCHYCKNLHRDVRYTCENDIRKKRKCKASFCSECIDSFFPEYYISEREDSDYEWICPMCKLDCICRFCKKKRQKYSESNYEVTHHNLKFSRDYLNHDTRKRYAEADYQFRKKLGNLKKLLEDQEFMRKVPYLRGFAKKLMDKALE